MWPKGVLSVITGMITYLRQIKVLNMFRDIKTVCLQFKVWQLRNCSPYFSRFPPMEIKYRFSDNAENIQNAYHIRNTTPNNFAIRDRINFPEGSRDIGVPNWQFSWLHQRQHFRHFYLSNHQEPSHRAYIIHSVVE